MQYTYGWTCCWLDTVWWTIMTTNASLWQCQPHFITEVLLCTVGATLSTISLRKKSALMFQQIHGVKRRHCHVLLQ